MLKNSRKKEKKAFPKNKIASSIGTRKESSLHRSLKFRYSGSGGATETLIGGYVCDVKTSKGEIIEVQTGSFGPLKEKVKNLAQSTDVRIVHPIINQKRIELYDTSGQLLRSRKSPRKGCLWDLFSALIHAAELPLLENLVIELAVIDVIEKRVDDGTGSWRRRGARIDDRLLGAWHESVILNKPKDYCRFIPFARGKSFTVKDLSLAAGINAALARKTLYVLSKINLVEKTGKQGNAFIYKKRAGH